MNEDVFNASIRKFLKTLGVGAQREIEKAVRRALAQASASSARNSGSHSRAPAFCQAATPARKSSTP